MTAHSGHLGYFLGLFEVLEAALALLEVLIIFQSFLDIYMRVIEDWQLFECRIISTSILRLFICEVHVAPDVREHQISES